MRSIERGIFTFYRKRTSRWLAGQDLPRTGMLGGFLRFCNHQSRCFFEIVGGLMKRVFIRLCFGLLKLGVSAESGFAQQTLSWQEVRNRFHAANRTLRAGQIGVEESRAEIIAYLRPNPNLNLVGSYLDAARQLNLAVGREVIQ
jgi:hypothetical protein